MQRRALLAAIPTTLAGCISTPSNTQRSTTTRSTEQDATYTVTDFDAASETIGPGHRFLVRITKVYSASAVEDEPGDPTVVDVSEIDDPDVRTVIEDTLSEGKLHRDTIPGGLREITGRVDFFTWNETTGPEDTASHWAIEIFEAHPDREPALRFDASLTDHAVSPDDPAAITFSIENVGETTQQVFSGTVPPFGVLWADRPGGDRYLLWRDYEDEGCVNFGDGHVVVCDIGIVSQVEPGETMARTYELPPENPVGSPLESGDYTVSGVLSYHQQPQGPRTELKWRVSFSVERA